LEAPLVKTTLFSLISDNLKLSTVSPNLRWICDDCAVAALGPELAGS